jgi:hypothetical protein
MGIALVIDRASIAVVASSASRIGGLAGRRTVAFSMRAALTRLILALNQSAGAEPTRLTLIVMRAKIAIITGRTRRLRWIGA